MFPLKTTIFPANAEALQRLLNESLRELFEVTSDPVTIRDASYPHLAQLTVSLDRARLRDQPPPMPSFSGNPTPALQVDSFKIEASTLTVGPAAIDLSPVGPRC